MVCCFSHMGFLYPRTRSRARLGNPDLCSVPRDSCTSSPGLPVAAVAFGTCLPGQQTQPALLHAGPTNQERKGHVWSEDF